MMGGGGGPARYVGLLCGLRGGLVEYTVSGKRMAGTVSTEQMRASCDGRAWLLFVYLGVVNSAGCAAGVGWMESQVGETASRFSRRASPLSWTSDHSGGASPAWYFSLRVLDKGVAKRRGSRGIRGLGPVLPRYQDPDCKVRGVGVAALPSTNSIPEVEGRKQVNPCC
jgi:hypothetical protein